MYTFALITNALKYTYSSIDTSEFRYENNIVDKQQQTIIGNILIMSCILFWPILQYLRCYVIILFCMTIKSRVLLINLQNSKQFFMCTKPYALFIFTFLTSHLLKKQDWYILTTVTNIITKCQKCMWHRKLLKRC